ncbi:flagellar protein FlaG [Brevibacillus agri]|uniref:flagellar protein FlaG n=1 Tax=Brevibacillus agri TaxID=51101 RepID=UPI003D737309
MDVSINSQSGLGTKAAGVSAQATPAGAQASKESKPEAETTAQQYSEKELGKAVDDLNKWIQQTQSTHLQFRLHEQLKEYYVEIVNDSTKEVIRQVPSKKIMDIAAKMQEMIGLLVDEKR